METIIAIIKYIFVTAAGVEVLLILWALVRLARDKARAAEPPAAAQE